MLKVVTAIDILTATEFMFFVAAGEVWSLRSVVANVARAAGGAPGRGYVLEITDGTSVVSAFPADDAGTEPGACEITWANCPKGSDSTGNEGIVSAPMRADLCPIGYQIKGLITGAVLGDQWLDAVVWCDFQYAPD